MRYSDDIIDEVRARSDIVDIISAHTALKKNGSALIGLCPFHGEKSPSFSVSPEKQVYHCFGCGAGGNVITFVMSKENLGFVDAVKWLADRARYALPESGDDRERALRERIVAANAAAARFYYAELNGQDGAGARAYLDKRGVSPAMRKRFGLGYAVGGARVTDKLLAEGFRRDELVSAGLSAEGRRGMGDRFFQRLMFPIFDSRGRVIAFGGRVMGDGRPKYLNSPETPVFSKSRALYALNFAKRERSERLFVCEGYMDVVSLHQYGFTNAVATLGTAFGDAHAGLIRQYAREAVLLFDADGAGENAVVRAIPILLKAGVSVKVLRLSGAKDPDEFLKAFGRGAFAEAAKNAVDHIEFQVTALKRNYDLADSAQKILFGREAAKLAATAAGEIEKDVYIEEISELTGISEEALKKESDRSGAGYARPVGARSRARPNSFDRSEGGKAADEARRNIIHTITASEPAARAVRACLPEAEMLTGFYRAAYRAVYALYEKKGVCYPPDLISRFEDEGEQRMIANVFARPPVYGDEAARLKMLNECLGVVKTAYYDSQLNALKAADFAERQRLAEAKRNAKKQYITDVDG
ncbi:MAG: DNA primase [Clostridiales bacterium]|jgi:DNA primase|nr:DNA primase [Clostridiales bacterium]